MYPENYDPFADLRTMIGQVISKIKPEDLETFIEVAKNSKVLPKPLCQLAADLRLAHKDGLLKEFVCEVLTRM